MFADPAGSRQISLEQLDDATLERVADFLAAGQAMPWAESRSTLAKTLRGRLQVLDGEKLVNFEERGRPEPEIYLVYFGALWCGPCVQFSPKLVEGYEQLKALAGNRFELVFVSSDRDGGEQLEYIRKVRMPWPVVKFSALGRLAPIERWGGRGIPSLVALTRDGEVIFHSYRGVEYLGPRHVLQQTMTALQPEAESEKRARHRLAVIQHRRAAAGGDAAAKAYLIAMDPGRYRTLEVKELLADLELDAQGRVTGAAFTPQLEAVVEYQLQQDAATWLFLPGIERGEPRAQRVRLPLKLP